MMSTTMTSTTMASTTPPDVPNTTLASSNAMVCMNAATTFPGFFG